jgi:predicted phosphohydrolase
LGGSKMIRLQIRKKRSDDIVEERILYSLFELEKFISRISSYDIRGNDYFIEKSQRVMEFFKRTYFAKFYVEYDRYITLCPLRDGQKRVKNYKKKTDSNKIFLNTLSRIQKYLDKSFKKYKMTAIIVMPKISFNREEIVKVVVEEKEPLRRHTCLFAFDKVSWTFKIAKLESSKPGLVLKLIADAINYTTTPTRIYREKHKVLLNENTIK